MNIDRLNTLADVLEHNRLPHNFEFDMGTVLTKHPCGTAGCIAGLALVLFNGHTGYDTHSGYACEVLDLDEGQADHLFFPTESSIYSDSDPKAAAAAIRTFIASNGRKSWH
jgi:hypothetical protein